jgi:hypothetical protein
MASLIERDAGQPPAGKGAGIDPNPVRPHLGLGRRGMAMHDNLAEILAARKKSVADPKQILFALTIERDAGPHTGMAEKIAAASKGRFQRSQKIEVRRGQRSV